jgi:hypothetical protein
VEPPYIVVLGAQIVVRYQGAKLSYIEAIESCRDSYSPSRFNTVPLYISLQSVRLVSFLSRTRKLLEQAQRKTSEHLMQRGCACVSTVSLSLCYMLEARLQSIIINSYLLST